METGIKKHIVQTEQTDWKPLTEDGVDTKGIYFKILRYDDKQKRPPSFLLKFDAGASYPYHNHPGGEEAFVIEGEVYFNEAKLSKGDYLYTPPGFKHSVKTETGCIILFIVPEEVEIIK
ncbi:cupin domain-containing protein [Flavobacterium sp.]|uniref:cupin domain-containing protein n=1 Tax=Flavobacterium sp. TaxID=239 RepID=UPI0025C6E5D8|nr:cupin domain-containing protein [Flavobacterium sp.]MBA4153667.1 anti-sigma factor [Flavobacterium sp.]